MSWKVVAESSVSCSAQDFYCGVDVWLQRPHVINRRLLGCVVVHESQFILSQDEPESPHNEPVPLSLGECKSQSGQSLRQLAPLVTCVLEEVGGMCNGDVIVRRMLPRMMGMNESLEAVITDKDHCTVTFCPLDDATPTISSGSYRLQLLCGAESKIVLYTWISPTPPTSTTINIDGVATPTLEWLKLVLLPKVSQWSEENATHPHTQKGQSLVPLSRYSELYRELKHKYGEPLVKNWPEATDPHKFVYEDIAIATYLLVLWELEREELNLKQKQSFLDLGCGNGLLVYLLTAEGHPGKGLDLRERRVWKMFREKATLEVATLTPSDQTLFPDYDWLLGNHSDELTPWIPVMAARSSYRTRYFVLPCCPHDFESKYRRRESGRSQYRSYLDYVREIGERMGFKVHEDTMRIPSSKRVCQVGRERSYPPSAESDMDGLRMAFLDQRCSSRSATPRKHVQTVPFVEVGSGESPPLSLAISVSSEMMDGRSRIENRADTRLCPSLSSLSSVTASGGGERSSWALGFQPRLSTEHVRNCSQVERGICELVVRKITEALLRTVNFVQVKQLRSVNECGCDGVEEGGTRTDAAVRLSWNRGGKLCLSEVAELLDSAVLQKLKREFGGLQTLLRNEHQVFQVHGGYVQLRDWSEMNQPMSKRSKRPDRRIEASSLRKTKMCWFYHHHPQGCPRADADCPYAHGGHERKERPNFDTIFSDVNLQ